MKMGKVHFLVNESAMTYSLENLHWVMQSRALLAEGSAPIVSDSECMELALRDASDQLRPLRDAGSLNHFLEFHLKSGRLGNLFEALLQFWLERLIGVRDLAHGIAIREGGSTQGELDFVFRWPEGWEFGGSGQGSSAPIEQWEAAVKFFMCIAPTPELAVRADSFVGQALVDRLDRKLELSLKKQLPLSETPRAREVLATHGFSGPMRSRLFFKGRLFYPLAWNWRHVAASPVVSPRHERGWWISWEGKPSLEQLMDADRRAFGGLGSRAWVILGKDRWMGRVSEPVGSLDVLDDDQLRARLDFHFAMGTNALQLARLERLEDGSWHEPAFDEGLGRGMVLVAGWPNSVENAENLLSKF
jgi:hypothetical protein